MKTIALFLLLGALAAASPVLTINPPGGSLSGPPGAALNWNLQIANDSDYLLISLVEFVSPTPLGSFTDLLSPGFVVIGPGQTDGGPVEFTIDPSALGGQTASGSIVVTYDLFGCDPNDANCDPASQQIGFSLTLDSPASVTVGTAGEVPEPSTFLLGFTALTGVWLARGRRRR